MSNPTNPSPQKGGNEKKGYIPSSPPPIGKPNTQNIPSKHGYQPSSPPPSPPHPKPPKK
jgi:hypothetical protein